MIKGLRTATASALLLATITTSHAYTTSPIDSAQSMALDDTVSARLSSRSDADYYKFTIPSDGDVEVTLEHESEALSRYRRTYWVGKLFAEDNLLDSIAEIRLDGSEQLDSLTESLEAGRYFLLVEDFYYTSIPYHLTVTFSEDGALETLPESVLDDALTLELNQNYRDSLNELGDLNHYQFVTPENGNLSLRLGHEEAVEVATNTDDGIETEETDIETVAEDTRTYWQADLFAADDLEQRIRTVQLKGNSDEVIAQEGLPAGHYFLRVRENHFSDAHYHFHLGFDASEVFEKSPNDSVETATVIELEQTLEANISSPNDIDFYALNITQDVDATLVLSHANELLEDSVKVFWKAQVYRSDDLETPLYNLTLNGEEFSDDINLSLSQGQYFIKVNDSYYNDAQYFLSVATTLSETKALLLTPELATEQE